METLKNKPAFNDYQVRSNRLVFRVGITAHATPASKVHITDLPNVVLRTEGKTATADAVEALTWTTAVDATNANFGILVDLGSDVCDKVLKCTVTEITALETSHTTKGPNASVAVNRHVTAAGNIAIEILATGLDLATESPTYVVEVDYLEAR